MNGTRTGGELGTECGRGKQRDTRESKGTPNKRDEIQQEWMDGKVAVIVATVSFGMGVDKASVR